MSSTVHDSHGLEIATKFPKTAVDWFTKITEPRKMGVDAFTTTGGSYKLAMKKSLVTKIIDKRTPIERAVKRLNEFWKNEIIGSSDTF